MLIVQKYGGSSLADGLRIRRAATRAAELHRLGYAVVMVVSAQGDTTDELIQKASELAPRANKREMDAYMAAGEQLSAGLMAMTLGDMGCDAVSLTGWQAGIRTDNTHGNARILGLSHDRVQRELEKGRIVVVAGFQGINGNEDVTTLAEAVLTPRRWRWRRF